MPAIAGLLIGLQVEPGWTCTKTSPSVCTQEGAHTHDVPSDPHIGPAPPPSSGGGGSPPPPAHKKRGHGWATALVVLAAVGAAAAVAYTSRERIYDHFPQVLC